MSYWKRTWTAAAAIVLSLAAVPGTILIIETPGVANADVSPAPAGASRSVGAPTSPTQSHRTFRRPPTTPQCRTTRHHRRMSPVVSATTADGSMPAGATNSDRSEPSRRCCRAGPRQLA